jgi:hypothetical protein
MDVMKTMNRRDYLLQMGAGTVGVMGSAPLKALADSGTSSAPEYNQPVTDLLWKPTTTFPTNAKVTVIFGGLFGFFYNTRTGNCEIGAHRGDHNHRMVIEVWERIAGRCYLNYSTRNGTLPKPTGELKIEIVGRPMSNANFYQVGDYNRQTMGPYDFRWMPDLDNDDFYPLNHPKKKGKFHIKATVRHGTFYTYLKTNSTFTRVDPPDEPVNHMDLYQVAEYMAAGIQPNDTENVSLKIDDNTPPVVLINRPGSTYEITVFNNCYKDASGELECEFQPNDPSDEEERNHFHFMRKLLKLPGGQRRYGLKLKVRNDATNPGFCNPMRKRISDEAPCMGAGFGKTDGMPQFP